MNELAKQERAIAYERLCYIAVELLTNYTLHLEAFAKHEPELPISVLMGGIPDLVMYMLEVPEPIRPIIIPHIDENEFRGDREQARAWAERYVRAISVANGHKGH